MQGKAGPNCRSQTLICHSDGRKWWIKVNFTGEIFLSPVDGLVSQKTPKRLRRKEYQYFIRLVDLGSLPLLNDTVSEVILEECTDERDSMLKIHNTGELTLVFFAKVSGRLRYLVRGDPLRVIYPSRCEFPSLRQINTAELSEESEITDGVFQVIGINKTPYILKVVNRPYTSLTTQKSFTMSLETFNTFKKNRSLPNQLASQWQQILI